MFKRRVKVFAVYIFLLLLDCLHSRRVRRLHDTGGVHQSNQASATDLRDPISTPSPRERKSVPWFVSWLILAVGVVGIGFCYVTYLDAVDSPKEPQTSGKARLYLERAGLDAEMTVLVNQEKSDENSASYNYFLSVDRSVGLDNVGFILVLEGSAKPKSQFPGGSRMARQGNGCPATVSVSGADDERCRQGVGVLDAIYANSSNNVTQERISGTLRRNNSGYLLATVMVNTGHPVEVSSGARTLVHFPSVGTTYLPEDGRDIPFDFGQAGEFYVPKVLDLAVEGRDFDSSERIDTLSPEPIDPGRMAWVDGDASTIKARGSTVNLGEERVESQRIFVLGAVLGVLLSIIPIFARATLYRFKIRPESLGL